MREYDAFDPYKGNILIKGLGPIYSRAEVLRKLAVVPTKPTSQTVGKPHIAMHQMMVLLNLFLPDVEVLRLHSSIDIMLRQSYLYRDPLKASTWSRLSGDHVAFASMDLRPHCGTVMGQSGTGKTFSIRRCLSAYPKMIHHESFPKLIGGLKQVVSLSIDAPAGGGGSSLAAALMMGLDDITGDGRFTKDLQKEWRDPEKMLATWLQVAKQHYLGILHIDEIQNLFKLPTLQQRRKKKFDAEAPELGVQDDRALKWLLTLINSGEIAVLISGTPDGVSALASRMATTERMVMSGFHNMRAFEDSKETRFRRNFLDQLGQYQYVAKTLPVDDELASLIIELTGGIQRIVMTLWVMAHRVAFERDKGDLLMSDFKTAASTYLAPLQPAIAALRSQDPLRMAKYEDLLPRNKDFWRLLWQEAFN